MIARIVEASDAADVLAVSHWEVWVPSGVREGVVHEFAEAGAAGEADEQ